jgi:hypothetical protein
VSGASKTVTAAKADPVWKAYIEAGIAGYNKAGRCTTDIDTVDDGDDPMLKWEVK